MARTRPALARRHNCPLSRVEHCRNPPETGDFSNEDLQTWYQCCNLVSHWLCVDEVLIKAGIFLILQNEVAGVEGKETLELDLEVGFAVAIDVSVDNGLVMGGAGRVVFAVDQASRN